MMEKNHMFISKNAQRESGKIQYPFMISKNIRYRKNVPQHSKGDVTSSKLLNGEKLKLFSLRSATRQGCLLFSTVSQYSIEILSQSNETREKI
jgi:hypothetical protein